MSRCTFSKSESSTLKQLIDTFHGCFLKTFRTRLIGGAEEPLYQPMGQDGDEARIYFRADYLSSALHEIAHWCVAGSERRKLEDYGYWYEPDGRNKEQQQAFEIAEVAPQAMEWIFSLACGVQFRVSADNLQGDCQASSEFKRAIYHRVCAYCENGLPDRAQRFAFAVATTFTGLNPLERDNYRLDDIE